MNPKFKVGDTVRLIDGQLYYNATWQGPMTVVQARLGDDWLVECQHPDHKQSGAFDDYELELVPAERRAPSGAAVVVVVLVSLLAWAAFVGYVGYKVVMS